MRENTEIIMSDTLSKSTCVICGQNSARLITVARGQNTLINSSKERKDGKHILMESLIKSGENIYVHFECRKIYTKKFYIESSAKRGRSGKRIFIIMNAQ